MNLRKLFEMQRQLDEHIEKEHPRQEGEDRLAKKILALQVELGELANEWRGFKFWSHDQEPRIVVREWKLREWKLYEDTIKEYGDSTHRRYEGVVRPVLRQPLLEEYVDCLHFILSIGLELGYDYETEKIEKYYSEEITHHFNEIFCTVCELIDTETITTDWDYFYMFGHFLGLSEMLGFTWEQVEEAYITKNAINHKRQDGGY